MPLVQTRGAASAQGFGEFAQAGAVNYIEDVFSTYLYTGTGATQTITNGIDLSTKGGLIWAKARDDVSNHVFTDTARGTNSQLASNSTAAQTTSSTAVTAFNTTGFNLSTAATVNRNGYNFVSWTFREQAKFFDVVTWSGNSTARTIAHNLGSAPGCIIVKAYSGTDAATANWAVYHQSLGNGFWLKLESTSAALSSGNLLWTTTAPTSTEFSLGGGGVTEVNKTGHNYVAYLFAHDAGGFGLTGTDNVISCGSFTVDGSGNSSINLGYEPQWLLMKQTNTTGSWLMQDTMRGQTADNGYSRLLADTSGAETSTTTGFIRINATGFSTNGATGLVGDHIYIAIRRGPMKVPTSGTSVLDVETYTGTQVARTITTANTVDLSFTKSRSTAGTRWNWTDRLRGATRTINSSLTAAEASDTTGYTSFAVQQGYTLGTGDTYDVNTSGRTYVSWNLTRSPSFFDEFCYTGTGSSATSFSHNLGVAPELIISKVRSASGSNWIVTTKFATTNYMVLALNLTNSGFTTGYADGGSIEAKPTSTVIRFTGGIPAVNDSGLTYVAYLFATCAGVSKVGSYTGTGTTLQVDCGFTGGARFVLIKRTDSTGDWYVWDSARGIVAGNDPYLLLNSTAAEVTGTDYVDTYSAGFEISSTAPAAINANGGTFIFLAIA